jgi:caa(3)-type oxidase subunit IV
MSHMDLEATRKTIKLYIAIGAALLVFTGLTVGANQLHLAVPAAITVALIIAIMKGSMVATVFMHLSHERKWIYGSLILTVLFFVVLMTVPLFTTMDNIGTPIKAVPAAEHAAGHER